MVTIELYFEAEVTMGSDCPKGNLHVYFLHDGEAVIYRVITSEDEFTPAACLKSCVANCKTDSGFIKGAKYAVRQGQEIKVKAHCAMTQSVAGEIIATVKSILNKTPAQL